MLCALAWILPTQPSPRGAFFTCNSFFLMAGGFRDGDVASKVQVTAGFFGVLEGRVRVVMDNIRMCP